MWTHVHPDTHTCILNETTKEREIELVERAPVAEEHITEVKMLFKIDLTCFLMHVRRSSPVCTPACGWLVPYQGAVLVLVRALLWTPQQQKSSASQMVLANLALVTVTPATSVITTMPYKYINQHLLATIGRNTLGLRLAVAVRHEALETAPLVHVDAGPRNEEGDGGAKVANSASPPADKRDSGTTLKSSVVRDAAQQPQSSSTAGARTNAREEQQRELRRVLDAVDTGTHQHRAVLGVADDATWSEIHRRHKRLVLLLHPDKCRLSRAGEAFDAVHTAYSELDRARNLASARGTDTAEHSHEQTWSANGGGQYEDRAYWDAHFGGGPAEGYQDGAFWDDYFGGTAGYHDGAYWDQYFRGAQWVPQEQEQQEDDFDEGFWDETLFFQ